MTSEPTPHTKLSARSSSGVEPAITSSPLPEAGQPFGRYLVSDVVGVGGMGRVYRAWDPQLERDVALKLLLHDNPEMVARFLREARTQGRIRHPSVCPVFEVGEVEVGRPYIAMQLVEGVDLLAASAEMSRDEALRLFVEVADAVHAAHRIGLVHRDLKPSNIMVERQEDGRWHPWVMDFGIAREVADSGLTATGLALGTPAYMAPEQALGTPGVCDRRTDVYGLGATLYELVARRPPFDGATGIEILIRLSSDEPVAPRAVDPSIPRDLETIILKCLEKDPAHRYASARELADDLQRLLRGDPISARRPGLAERLLKRMRKHRVLSTVIAVAVLSVASLASITAITAWRSRERQALAHRFGQEVTAMESAMRIAHLLPLHDLRPTIAAVRERIKRLERSADELGELAAAPAHFAVGCGHLALDEPELARQHLEQAWREGVRTPEAALALGVSLGALYQQELAALASIRDNETRTRRRREIEARFRDPALSALAEVSSPTPAINAYVQGLIALYEGRFEEALLFAQRAAASQESMYEAWSLAGEIHLTRARQLSDAGTQPLAQDDLQAATAALERAAEIARSDPAIAVAMCRRWSLQLELDGQRGEVDRGSFTQGILRCDQALAANPDSAAALIERSRLQWRFAEQIGDRGEDPVPLLESAVTDAERAVGANPDHARAHTHLGVALEKLGSYRTRHGLDPAAIFDRAVAAFDRAAELDPSDFIPRNNRGLIWWQWARWKINQGGDPLPDLERAAQDFDAARELAPDHGIAHANHGLVKLTAGMYLSRRGTDPEPFLAAAVESFGRALELNPHLAVALNSLGAAHWTRAEWQQGHGLDPRPALDDARRAFMASRQENPNNPRVHNNLGSTAASYGEYALRAGADPLPALTEAGDHLDRALQLNPEDSTAAVNRARVCRILATHRLATHQGVDDLLGQAHAAILVALRINPSSIDALVEQAAVALVQADAARDAGAAGRSALAQARASLERALELNPERFEPHLEMARLELAQYRVETPGGDRRALALERGLAAASTALAVNPRAAAAHTAQGRLLAARAEITSSAEDAHAALRCWHAAIALDALIERELASDIEHARHLAGQ